MPEITDFPVYTCHKKVRAAKIARVDYLDMANARIYFENGDWGYLDLSIEKRPTPQPGWYVVWYENGYHSFSPGSEFEGGYTKDAA